EAQIFGVFQRPVHDEVGEDRLLLLPPSLAVMPDVAVPLLALGDMPLHHVVPATALAVHADAGHDPSDLARERDVLVAGPDVVDAEKVPGDLEVVADD